MLSMTVTCPTPDATFELGARLGAALKGGDVVFLKGPLGAGKTIFTKGILSALGFDTAEVTSPSFTLVNRYDADLTVYHIDLWRIEDPEGASFSVGLEEILEDEDAVVVIEWAERLGKYDLGTEPIGVEISGDGDSPREIRISGDIMFDGA
ncbi:MAG: tRNA (adenosine(37)-N6)-threonylcarbamoyltransferase complex ATPase subunit type 1 TsaE [Aridibacter famidurans]|nr:tRNA (adenosine(37)-N6)-threonylcarbamoyltransferase complex ATPase subunit type 1 TsaE [Aridibacter famidurans]